MGSLILCIVVLLFTVIIFAADNSIRYFHDEDKPRAEKLKTLLDDKTRYQLTLKQVKGFENKVKVGQLEFWLK